MLFHMQNICELSSELLSESDEKVVEILGQGQTIATVAQLRPEGDDVTQIAY